MTSTVGKEYIVLAAAGKAGAGLASIRQAIGHVAAASSSAAVGRLRRMQQLGLLLLVLRTRKHCDVVLGRLALLRLCVKPAVSRTQWEYSRTR